MDEKTLRLLDAILEAYDNYHEPKDMDGKPGLETACNFSVNHVCSRMGYDKFKGMVANQIIDFMRRKVSDWEPVKADKAQELANNGRVVIAGKQEPGHGHVVVVRPGIAEFSPKWETRVPKVSHVGKASCIGKHIGWAFGQEPPELWVLKAGEHLD